MCAVDAEFVEHATDHVGEVAERIVVLNAFRGAAVARHVGNDDAEVLGQRIDVAGIVGHAGRTGSSAVEHDHGRTGSGFSEEDRLACDGHGALGQGGGHAATPDLVGVDSV